MERVLPMFFRTAAQFACTAVLAAMSLAPAARAQMGGMDMKPDSSKPLPSPAAKAAVTLNGKAVTIDYNSPRMRGRVIVGEVVPYGKVWRTGANPATTLKTAANLQIGTLDVPAGTYTIYTLPSESGWLLIVNKQTGQWGTEYDQKQDLGRTPMTKKTAGTPLENMTIDFENTKGAETEMHVKWEMTDQYVPVKAQ